MALLGPFHGAIAVPSVTRCRCRRRRWHRGHRCAGGVRQYSGDTWWMRWLVVANGPNIFQMLLLKYCQYEGVLPSCTSKIKDIKSTTDRWTWLSRRGVVTWATRCQTETSYYTADQTPIWSHRLQPNHLCFDIASPNSPFTTTTLLNLPSLLGEAKN